MRQHLLYGCVLICCLFSGNVVAQSLSSMSIGYTGGYVSTTEISVSFSGGDVVTGTLSGEGVSLFQGFPNSFNVTPTSLDQLAGDIPLRISLEQNYPNPFNPSTLIRYATTAPSQVRLAVYDLLGRELEVLVNEARPAGVFAVTFDASRYASGVYLYMLQIDGRLHQTRKMILVK